MHCALQQTKSSIVKKHLGSLELVLFWYTNTITKTPFIRGY